MNPLATVTRRLGGTGARVSPGARPRRGASLVLAGGLGLLLHPTLGWAAKPSSALHVEVLRSPGSGGGTARIRLWSEIELPRVKVAVTSSGGARTLLETACLAHAYQVFEVEVAAGDRAILATTDAAAGIRHAAVSALRMESLPEHVAGQISVDARARHFLSSGPAPFRVRPLAAEAITVQGLVSYRDQLYDQDGLTGATADVAVRHASVYLLDASGGRVLRRGNTDALGRYSLTLKSSRPLQLKVSVASIGTLPTHRIRVLDSTATRRLYAAESVAMSAAPGDSIALDLIATGAAADAFNALDQGVRAFDFISTLSPVRPPRLNLYWEPGSVLGTYFARPNIVHLGGRPEDNDAIDDDVILHEIGHFYMLRYSDDDSTGGAHSLNDTAQDPRLSWAEGFASYFSSAVRDQGSYVDTFGPDASFFADWEQGQPAWLGPQSEAAVTMALWDLHDAADALEPFDALADRDTDVAEVNQEYLARQKDVSVLDFCPGWSTRGIADYAALQQIFLDRAISCP